MMTALRTVQLEKSTLYHVFFFTHRYTNNTQAPPPPAGTRQVA